MGFRRFELLFREKERFLFCGNLTLLYIVIAYDS